MQHESLNIRSSNTQVLQVAQKILENTSNWLIQQGSTVEMIDFSLPDLPLTSSETVDRYLSGQIWIQMAIWQ